MNKVPSTQGNSGRIKKVNGNGHSLTSESVALFTMHTLKPLLPVYSVHSIVLAFLFPSLLLIVNSGIQYF